MDRVWKANASGTPPATPTSFSVGYPRSANDMLGQEATSPGPWWYHMITEELRNVVVAAGLTPSGATLNQLAGAIVALAAAGGSGGLSTALANLTNAAQGPALVAFNPTKNYALRTIGAAVRHSQCPLSQFEGADPTGATDNAALITSASAMTAALGSALVIDGSYRYDSQIILAEFSRTVGNSHGSYFGRPTPYSRLIKNFNAPAPGVGVFDYHGAGVLLAYDDCSVEGVQFDSVPGKTGVNVQIMGNRIVLDRCTTSNGAGTGYLVGSTETTNPITGLHLNANCWKLINCRSTNQGSHGLDVNNPIDANAGTCIGFESLSNGGDGIRETSGAWNTYIGYTIQGNSGIGFRLMAGSRSCQIFGGDIEAHTAGRGVIEANSFGHIIHTSHYGGPAWVDNSGYPERNKIVQDYGALNNPFGPADGKMSDGCASNLVEAFASYGVPRASYLLNVATPYLGVQWHSRRVGTTGAQEWLRVKKSGANLADTLGIDDAGLMVVPGAIPSLTIASNSCAPLKPRSFINGGLLKTMTPPTIFAGNNGELVLIPTSALTTDTTGGAGGFALAVSLPALRPAVFHYDSGSGKWYV